MRLPAPSVVEFCRNRSTLIASLFAVGMVALTLVAVGGDARAEEPLSEEEVVRLWVAKTPTPELLKLIRSRPAGFALDPEMLDELRTAGLPRELIEAMVSRQREADLASGSAPPDEPAESETKETEVRFVDPEQKDDPIVLSIPRIVQPGELQALGVRDPEADVEDLAVYVACLNPAYVPDRWRSKTPLGRDFSAPRHRMLAFHSGADVETKRVKLTLPESLAFELDEAPPWSIEVGTARRIGGRFYRLSSVLLSDYDPASGGTIVVEVSRSLTDPVLRIRPTKAID